MSDIPWTWLMIRASGITAWGLLSAVVLYGLLLRTRLLGSKAQPATLLTMHRWLGSIALGALALHMGLLLIDPEVAFSIPQILIPGLAPWQPFEVALGIVAFWLLIGVGAAARLRTRLGKAGNTVFRRAHLLAFAAWPLATAHYVMAGTDAMAEWSIALLIAVSSLLVFALLARGFVPPPARPTTARPTTVRPATEATTTASPASADTATSTAAAPERVSVPA